MAATTEQLELLRKFSGADPDTESAVLNVCWDFAVSWYEEAGVASDCELEAYTFWVCNLAAWAYDHRAASDDVPALFVHSVHQLR